MGVVEDVVQAWREAAEDLGISVEAPFTVSGDDGQGLQFVAHVHGFGGGNGALVGTTKDTARQVDFARRSEFFYSQLNPGTYARYSPDLFKDTLCDWGWFDENTRPPAWFAAKPWS